MSLKHQDLYKKLVRKKLMYYQMYYLFYFFAAGSFTPFFSLYLYEGINLSKTNVGQVLSLLPFINIFIQPLWGMLNDKFRLDRSLVLISLVSVCIFQVMILSNNSFNKVLIFTVLYGIFACSITPIQDSLSMYYVRKYKLKFAHIRIFGSIGWALATFVTGYLIGQYSYGIIKYLLSVSLGISFILFLLLKRIKIKVPPKEIKRNNNFKKVLTDKTFVVFLIFSCLSMGVFNSVGGFYNIKLNELKGSASVIGYLTTITVGLEIISLYLTMVIKSKFNDLKMLRYAIILQLPVLLMFTFSDNLYLLYAILLIRGIYQGIQISVMMNLIASLLPRELLTTGVILYSSLSVGMTSSILIYSGGFFADRYSLNLLFFIFFLLVFISLICSLILERMVKSHRVTWE